MDRAMRSHSRKPQNLADLFAFKSTKQHKLRELAPYTLEKLATMYEMFEGPGDSPLMDAIRLSMDKSGGTNTPLELSPSACLPRIFPYFDKAELLNDDETDDSSVRAADSRFYKVALAEFSDGGERLYASLKTRGNKNTLELVVFSPYDGRFSTDTVKNWTDNGYIKLYPWIPSAAIKNTPQLIAVIKTGIIYKGAIGGQEWEFSKSFGYDLARVCYLLPVVSGVVSAEPLDDAMVSSASTSITLAPSNDQDYMQAPASLSSPCSSPVRPRTGFRRPLLMKPSRSRRHFEVSDDEEPTIRDHSEVKHDMEIVGVHDDTGELGLSSSGDLTPQVLDSPVDLELLRKLHAAQKHERSGEERLLFLQERAILLDKQVETAQHHLGQLKHERDNNEVEIREIKKQIADAREIQRDGAASMTPDAACFFKRLAEFIPDGKEQ